VQVIQKLDVWKSRTACKQILCCTVYQVLLHIDMKEIKRTGCTAHTGKTRKKSSMWKHLHHYLFVSLETRENTNTTLDLIVGRWKTALSTLWCSASGFYYQRHYTATVKQKWKGRIISSENYDDMTWEVQVPGFLRGLPASARLCSLWTAAASSSCPYLQCCPCQEYYYHPWPKD